MNENLLNVMGSFSETALDCIEKQNEEIEDLKKENTRLKDKIEKAINILNDPWSFESGNKEVDEITYQKKREVIELLKEK